MRNQNNSQHHVVPGFRCCPLLILAPYNDAYCKRNNHNYNYKTDYKWQKEKNTKTFGSQQTKLTTVCIVHPQMLPLEIKRKKDQKSPLSLPLSLNVMLLSSNVVLWRRVYNDNNNSNNEKIKKKYFFKFNDDKSSYKTWHFFSLFYLFILFSSLSLCE